MSTVVRDSVEIAREAAHRILAEFSMGYVRVWLFSYDESHGPVATAVIPPGTFHGGLVEEALAEIRLTGTAAPEMIASIVGNPRFAGAFPGNAFIGVPLAHDATLAGYIEAYREKPIAFAEAASIVQYAESVARALAPSRLPESVEMPIRGTILVADDDPATRTLLRRILTNHNFRVIDVENGKLACVAAMRDKPDLILLDWVMPVMDGREATRVLKADPQSRAVPVIMLTSQNEIDEKVVALESGVQDFLTKPVEPRELVARIEQHLRWRQVLAPAPSEHERFDPHKPEPLPTIEPGGDLWARAMEAQQNGSFREALALAIAEAERCDADKQFPRAAVAYRTASHLAAKIGHADLSNKCMRLSGKMNLCWAETASEPKAVKEAYLNAARCFIIAGNLKLTKKSVDIVTSLDNVLADDRPSAIG
jgi:DNA-binding response OmpR family regulator